VDDTQRNVDDVFQFDGGIQVSGVVSGTTVRALALGCFSQKKLKIELKDNAKK